MIDFFVARDGSTITKVDGKYTASRYFPANDAKNWYQSISYYVSNYNSFIFLGVGSGHHIVEFLRQNENKKILVIEKRKALINFFKETFPLYSARIVFVQLTSPSEALSLSEIKIALNDLCYVVENAAAMSIEGIFYFEIKKLLLGRDPDFFKMHLSFFDNYKKSFVPFLRLVENQKNLLSIKDLEKIVQSDEENKSVLNRVKLLRELVV